MEFCNTLMPHYKMEYFESSMDLCPLESFKGFNDRNSIYPLSESNSNRTVDECIHCNDRPDYECIECTCQICGHKTRAAKRYRCNTCKKVFHEWCQNISDNISASDHWQCTNCLPPAKDFAASGKELVPVNKSNRQIAIRPIRKMHHASRTSQCTIVPANHFGPIPNIPVGTCWEYRLQASEAGVHRPLVAGIHGRENEGAYSIVISGCYADDFDNGDEFFYSGSGGRASDPSKRLSAQIRNQLLTKSNKALALCCDCPLNDREGGTAKNWRAGKPVRVIRNYKLAKFSKYAPTEGNRYDGIYKVVKYFPQKGASGFMIWKYLLRRDDPTPAPWTDEGKQLIEQLGLKIIKISPDIIEEAEEYEYTTIKLEVNEAEPFKKKFKRIRCKVTNLCTTETRSSSSPRTRSQVKISTSLFSTTTTTTKFKEERLSPPPSPTSFNTSYEDVKPIIPRPSLDVSEYPLIRNIKSSPPHEPTIPSFELTTTTPSHQPTTPSFELTTQLHDPTTPPIPAIKCEKVENDDTNDGANSSVQMTSFTDESSCVSNPTCTGAPMLPGFSIGCIQSVHSTSTEFTQSMSRMSYLDNAYMPPTYLTSSINDTFTNHERTYFPTNNYIQPPEPLPMLKMTVSNVRSLDTTNDTCDFGFKRIKLSKPISLKPADPVVPESPPKETTSASETNDEEKSPMSVTKENGAYELSDHIKDLIGKDILNKCWWDLCLEKYLPLGKQSFIENVRQIFTCPCCHKIAEKPVTLKCDNRHNACFNCMTHRFDVFKARSCPSCQELFGPSTKLRINETLSSILLALFPDNNLELSYSV
ncbi:E3 ubiquitin-protein ligase UHRF1-like [Planococcus citri]|uniref:E3 ubiquitin-protein ligase UHRF1-like n=1 Tax=Planococcus citri TaxID=170843 RepID=UPI0031F882AF